MADEKSVGGIWEQESKGGKKYLSISIDGVGRFVAFKNDRKKEGEKTPDWRIFESKPRDAQPEQKDDGEIPF